MVAMTTRSKLKIFFILALIFVAGVVFAGLFNVGLSATNTTEFCISCHSMEFPYKEYQESVHYKNASGVKAGCADCHVPKSLGPKLWMKINAYNDVLHQFLGTVDTPEKYEEHRWEMASRVWAKMKSTDSRECRSCHDFADMDLSEQDKMGRKKHGNAEDKGQTCIDCHKGIAHEEPIEPEQ